MDFIGANLCEYLCKKYPDVPILNVSKHTYAVQPKMIKYLDEYRNYKYVPLDIFDCFKVMNVFRDNNVVRIYHLAAESHVDRSFQYPRDFIVSNIEGTFSLLEACRTMRKIPRFFYMGTDEVFGSVKEGFRTEEHMPRPENPYAATKVAAEALCQAWMASFKIPIVIARSMNVYGPLQHAEKLVPKIITNILSGKEYSLYKGNSMRGWSFVYDTVEAIDKIMTHGRAGEIYHIPQCGMKGVYDINEFLLDLMPQGRKLFKGYINKRLKDDDRYAISGTKMQFELGWMPKHTWEEGMKLTVEWYDKNRGLWM